MIKKVLDKAIEKKVYLSSLYTKDNTSWNRVIDEFIDDMDYTIEEFSTKKIREECCESEIRKIEKIDLEYLILTQLRKEIIWSKLCNSYHCGNTTLICHDLVFSTSEIEIRFKNSIDGYKEGKIYKLPLSEYFILDEKYWHEEVEYKKNNPENVNVKDVIQAVIYIRVNNSDRIDLKKLGQVGYYMEFGTIKRLISNVKEESIDIDYLFGLGVSLIDISFNSCLKSGNSVGVSFKNTIKSNKIVKINKTDYVSDEFMNTIKKYLGI